MGLKLISVIGSLLETTAHISICRSVAKKLDRASIVREQDVSLWGTGAAS